MRKVLLIALALFGCKTNNNNESSSKDIIPASDSPTIQSEQLVNLGCFLNGEWDSLCNGASFEGEAFKSVIPPRNSSQRNSIKSNILTIIDSKKELLVLSSSNYELPTEKLLNGDVSKSLKAYYPLFADHIVLSAGENLREVQLDTEDDTPLSGRITKLMYCPSDKTGCYAVGIFAAKSNKLDANKRRVFSDDGNSMSGAQILALCSDLSAVPWGKYWKPVPADKLKFASICDLYFDKSSSQLKIRMK